MTKTNENKDVELKPQRKKRVVNKTKTTKKVSKKENKNLQEDVIKNEIKKDVRKKLKEANKQEIAIDLGDKVNKTKKTKDSKVFMKKGKLKVIPLGGMQEIGKNMTAFEYENEIIVVDCGLAFPEDEMLGVYSYTRYNIS